MEYISALAIGFFGSLHCIGMCGPIAFALPVTGSSNIMFAAGRILYNIGRVISYGILGAIFGMLGSHIVLFGFQQFLSIALGAVIIIYVILPANLKAKFRSFPYIVKLLNPLKENIGKLFKQKGIYPLFLIGFLNGFLPCGFVYIGLAGAMAAGNAVSGMGVMLMFGIGTIPVMFAASVFGKFVNLSVRKKINRLVPALAVLLALIFILRGLNLGIPYLSPKLKQTAAAQIQCNH